MAVWQQSTVVFERGIYVIIIIAISLNSTRFSHYLSRYFSADLNESELIYGWQACSNSRHFIYHVPEIQRINLFY